LTKNINIQTEDSELIECFLNGDKSAFNLIVLKYQKKIYWVIRKMVLEHQEADDITQEVFIKLYTSIKDFRGESALFTYLYKMAINFSLNYLKKNKIKQSREKPLGDNEYEMADTNNTSSNFDNEKRSLLFAEAIKTLPDMQRLIFNMRFYDDLTYQEISKILNKSVGGLKANYFHAFKKISEFLKSKKKEGYIDYDG